MRVWVFGVSGSGKSNLAADLASAYSINCYHLDDVCWQPNWQVMPKRQFITSVEKLANSKN